jgi:pimeloyl-ACP methyl ester carboxylesterase
MKPQAEVIRQQMNAMPKDQYEAMLPLMVAQMVKDPEAQKKVTAESAASDRTVAFEAMYEDLLTDMRGELPKIKTPALVVFAVDTTLKKPDPVQYEALVRAAYKPMPNVTLVKVEDSRHFIMYDQPAKLDAAVEGFLK